MSISIHNIDGNTFAKKYLKKNYHIDRYICLNCFYRDWKNREHEYGWGSTAIQVSYPNCPDCGSNNWKIVEDKST